VELLAEHFLERLNRENATEKRFTEGALDRLRSYAWPGNVRELKHVVERAYILATTDVGEDCVLVAGAPEPASATETDERLDVTVGLSVAEMERRLVLATLAHCDGNKAKAAEILGISLKTLYNRLNVYKGVPPSE
jgi:DNA-binding NtrC family response regulator